MFSRERVTCFTQLCSDPKIEQRPELALKGKGTQTHLTPPKGVHYQWAPNGSYRIEQILGVVDKLPNRFNRFTKSMYWMIILFI